MKGVAICPYPNGVVYKVSLVSQEGTCQVIKGEKTCSDEYDTKNIAERTTSHGGSFSYHLPTEPINDDYLSGYLVVKGYLLHPPWK
jgi:hypothetical protein